MTLTLKMADDGELYHAQENEDGTCDFIKEEDGSLIPAHMCLCYAHEPSECVCACTSWDNYSYDDDY